MRRLFFTFLLFLGSLLDLNATNAHMDYQWVVVPDHNDWLYRCGERPQIDIQLYKYGMPVAEQKIAYTISTVKVNPDISGELTVKNGKASLRMPSWNKPGFREVSFKFIDSASGAKCEHHITLGFDADKITPYTQEPADFRKFWEDQVRENHEKFPMEYTIKKLEDYSDESAEVYLVKLKVDGNHQLYGYLGKPVGAEPGSCPVMICPPGAGIKPVEPSSGFAADGIITFRTEIHGIDPMLDKAHYDEIYCAFKESPYHAYYSIGIESRERYYMKHVYLGLVRCIDFLTSLPEWDGKNVIAKGGSQGGGLSLMIAGLDKRVTLCVPNYPALADMCAGAEPGRTSGYPHYEKEPEFLTETALKTLPYFDVVNFAKYIECPTFMTWGYNDTTCPATTSYAVWNVMTCPKESLITPINEHWHTAETVTIQKKWIKEHLKYKTH